jgi:phage terminase large subunit-like protein
MTPDSLAEELLELEPAERRAALKAMSHGQRVRLQPYWKLWAHDGQVAPDGAWHTWVIMAGRAIIYLT